MFSTGNVSHYIVESLKACATFYPNVLHTSAKIIACLVTSWFITCFIILRPHAVLCLFNHCMYKTAV